MGGATGMKPKCNANWRVSFAHGAYVLTPTEN